MARNDLTSLRERTLARADMVSGGFVPNTELDDFINDAHEALYDMLVGLHEPYFETSTALNIVSGTTDYSLPSDFYKLTGVDVLPSGASGTDYVSIRPYTNADRNRYTNRLASRLLRDIEEMRYMLRGGVLRLAPEPKTNYTGRILYVPQATELSDAADTIDANIPTAWSRWIVLDAAIKCLQKEESDTAALMAERAMVEKAIRDSALNRDADSPAYIADVRYRNAYTDDTEIWEDV